MTPPRKEQQPAWSATAMGLGQAFAHKRTTPSLALEAILARIEALNPLLKAIVTLDPDGAKEAARESSARWQAGNPLGPLDGVPVTIKDNLYVKGMRATWGSRLFGSHVAPHDDVAISRLRAGGCIILGKTNTPELAMAGHTNSPLFGATANPWQRDRSPGGSSGGAVCAVAAGFCPIALGTDAGGSIRRPAGYSGVVGLKPSLGRVPRRFGFPPLSHDLQVIGGAARTIADMRMLFETIADPVEVAAPIAPEKLRIAVIGRVEKSPVDPEVSSAFRRACSILDSLGHELVAIEAPWSLDEVGRIFNTIASVGIARVVTKFAGWEGCVTPGVAGEVRDGLKHTLNDYLEILDALGAFRWRMRDVMAEWDMLATPSAACLPWSVDEPHAKTIDGQPAGPRAAGAFTVAVNLAGLPAIVIPAPRDTALPVTGLQLIGPAGNESRLLDLAAEVEAKSPWPRLAVDN